MKSPAKERQSFDYTWVIIAISFLMIFTCLGFCSSNKSLFLSAITEAQNFNRSAYSLSDSFRYVATAVVNMFFGTLVYRYGTKKLIIAGFVFLILSSLLYSFASSLILFYIAGALLGVGLSWTTTTMIGSIVNKWCKTNRGTIMGIVLSANGLGGALAAQIVTPIIYQEGTLFGYQSAYRLVALILAIVAVLVVLFYKENPPEDAPNETVTAKKKSRGQSWKGVSPAVAMKQGYFYIALVCIFLTGMILQGISGISAAHMKDVGLDVGYIATVVSISSLVLTVSKFSTGFLYDRLGLRFTMTVCDIAAVVVMLSLMSITNSSAGRIFAMLYAVLAPIALPLETIMLPIFAGDFFGDKAYNKILGIFVSVNTAGYALGTPLVNFVYDICGTYKPVLLICAILMVVVTLLSQSVVTMAHKKRRELTGE